VQVVPGSLVLHPVKLFLLFSGSRCHRFYLL